MSIFTKELVISFAFDWESPYYDNMGYDEHLKAYREDIEQYIKGFRSYELSDKLKKAVDGHELELWSSSVPFGDFIELLSDVISWEQTSASSFRKDSIEVILYTFQEGGEGFQRFEIRD